MKAVAEFRGLTFEQKLEAFPQIETDFNAAKANRIAELEGLIRALAPGNKPQTQAIKPKYRSKLAPAKTWAGRGQTPTWLKAEMAESGLKLEDFKT